MSAFSSRVNDQPDQARPKSDLPTRFTKRNVVGLVAFALAFIVVVASVIGVTTTWSESESEGPPSPSSSPLSVRVCEDGLALYLPYLAQQAGGNELLTRLSCESAPMRASIPVQIGIYTKLTHIDLSNTKTKGTLPSELGLLTELETLSLNDNPDLTGSLPFQLGNMVALKKLDLANNVNMRGSLPMALKQRYDQRLLSYDYAGSAMGSPAPTSAPTPTPAPTEPQPSQAPTKPQPSTAPTLAPTKLPTTEPTKAPTKGPTKAPTKGPTMTPTLAPTKRPTMPTCRSGLELYLQHLALEQGGIVTELDCRGISIDTSIPSSIALYTNLTSIDLANTGTTGTMPSQLALLLHLQTLDVSGNSMSGDVPERVYNMADPGYLDLNIEGSGVAWTTPGPRSCNSGIDLYLPHLYRNSGATTKRDTSGVTSLVCTSNFYSTIPTSIGLYVSLTEIILHGHDTNIRGTLPSEIGNLGKLTELVVSHHKDLTGTLPVEFGRMSALKQMNLNDNPKLNGTIPWDWGNLEGLSNMQLQNNVLLTGKVQELLFNLVNHGSISPTGDALLKLNLDISGSGVQYQDSYRESRGCGSGWALYLPFVLRLNIEHIHCEGHSLLTSIPRSIGLYPFDRLASITIVENENLTGTIPTELGLLGKRNTGLQRLRIDQNPNLEGTLPSEIANLEHLRNLQIFGNSGITGSLPSEWGRLPNLTWAKIYVMYGLTGGLPSEWIDMTNNEGFYGMNLFGNSGMTGAISDELAEWSLKEKEASNHGIDCRGTQMSGC